MRTVLLTGATGAIGSSLARCLLEEEGTHLTLLLRATSASHLEQRLQELCAFWGVRPDAPLIAGRLKAIAGDVTLPRLGLDELEHRRLASEISHVIHSAGNVKLNRPLDEARRSAVDSAGHIVAFVDACRAHGPFEKLEFVSTVGVGGKMGGTVPERALPEPRTFNNTYEEAKAEAEAFLLDAMARGVPATIHRPSMVVGDSVHGRVIQFQVFYYLCEFLSGRRTAGLLPDVRDARLDIIPVDYVARAIQASSLERATAGRIFHLCSGSQAPRIADLAQRVRERFVAHGKAVPPLRTLPTALVRALVPVAARLSSGNVRRALQSLPYFLAYLDAPQIFANTESDRFFSERGVRVPDVNSYLDAVLSYYLSRQAGAATSGAATRVA